MTDELFTFDDSDLEQMIKAIGATPEIAKKSLQAALVRTQKWLATRMGRSVSKATNMPVRAIKARVRLGYSPNRIEARVWIGLNPMAAGLAGNPRGAKPGSNKGKGLNKPGVKVGKYHFPHAFIFHGSGSKARVVRRTGPGRYPLENVTIPIADRGFKALARKEWPDAQTFFLNEYERNLKFRMQKLAAKRVT